MRPILIMQWPHAGLSALLLLAMPALAQNPSPPLDFVTEPKITAQIIVDSLRPPAGAKHSMDRTTQQWYAYDQAHAYLRAATDALTVKWCPPAGLQNIEIHGEIISYLAKLPPTTRQGNAMPLIADALVAKFPCSTRKEH